MLKGVCIETPYDINQMKQISLRLLALPINHHGCAPSYRFIDYIHLSGKLLVINLVLNRTFNLKILSTVKAPDEDELSIFLQKKTGKVIKLFRQRITIKDCGYSFKYGAMYDSIFVTATPALYELKRF